MSVRADYNRHLMHPWADLPTLGEDDSTPVIVRGEGIYIEDDQGNRMIDGPGGMWCMQTGYGREEIAQAADRLRAEPGTRDLVLFLPYRPMPDASGIECGPPCRTGRSKAPGSLHRR